MQVWNLDEAAKFLRMSAYTLREQVSAGKVPGVKMGGEWRFTDESLEDFMRQQIAQKQKPSEPEVKRKRRPRSAPPPLPALVV